MFALFPAAVAASALVASASGRTMSNLQQRLMAIDDAKHSLNISSCPGYTVTSVKDAASGFVAQLALAGETCNAFGKDYASLTLEVTYESKTRLHVNIYDTVDSQFRVPDSVVARPAPPTKSFTDTAELVFNYTAAPDAFAFWITRRDNPEGVPLFDTRIASLPKTPIPPVRDTDNSTALDGFQLVFEDQYLQLTSALPYDANIYGLGEVLASSGYRRAVTGNGTIQALWARDIADPVDENVYGTHPIYMEHRLVDGKAQTHGVFLLSSAGGDILLMSPPDSNQSLIEYRMIGGVLDLYFLAGPSPVDVITQYSEIVGLPLWQPYWGFGLHLCRWGYSSVNETREQVVKMREANIPLEVMWNDIDMYQAYRDFTLDSVNFAPDEMRAFIKELHSNNQRYIPIVDAAIAKQIPNGTDSYPPYVAGKDAKVFLTNPDGSEYVGQVWPGYTVYPDWFAENAQSWWTEALRNWTSDVDFAGIWYDMNEVSSFCDGSCGSGIDISNTSVPFILPGEPGNLVADYPECYDATISGPSGNITVNGVATCNATKATASVLRRGIGAGNQTDIDINFPPYAIHNGFGPLYIHTVATNATHAPGYAELDVHSLYGHMGARATYNALKSINNGTRPFVISRSTFASSGKSTGHWLGDNFSKWEWMYHSIQGILQFQLFQIPFVGSDSCGFVGNTDEELCNRWMQLSAFAPFYRNHNIRGAIPQEPYRWDSVADATRKAIAIRYALLPYWYTLFANSSRYGTPAINALWYEYPTEQDSFGIDRQFLVGRDILVTPVLEPSATTVDGVFPGSTSGTTWRDWYTHRLVNTTGGSSITLEAPLSHINVHIRSGSVILLHAEPGYTIKETRDGPFALLVSLDANGTAHGTAYLDDGISDPPGPSVDLKFAALKGSLKITAADDGQGQRFDITSLLHTVTILGVAKTPGSVSANGKSIPRASWEFDAEINKLILTNLAIDLNKGISFAWH
ncbi:glycosyl hydrolases family 31-domain-containing protein [Auriculariales sp. MPI-PUGE-AT-0066]|nr:glycosyl hydrolases family 31-domain-containing protein [Auriculariales sp. MPI-PUGE-AT-0066]